MTHVREHSPYLLDLISLAHSLYELSDCKFYPSWRGDLWLSRSQLKETSGSASRFSSAGSENVILRFTVEHPAIYHQ